MRPVGHTRSHGPLPDTYGYQDELASMTNPPIPAAFANPAAFATTAPFAAPAARPIPSAFGAPASAPSHKSTMKKINFGFDDLLNIGEPYPTYPTNNERRRPTTRQQRRPTTRQRTSLTQRNALRFGWN